MANTITMTIEELLGPIVPWCRHRHVDIDRSTDYIASTAFGETIALSWMRDSGGVTVAMIKINELLGWAVDILLEELND